jgi:hypothetical protein
MTAIRLLRRIGAIIFDRRSSSTITHRIGSIPCGR